MTVRSFRAHHFMCIATYRGKGYSADFVENMNRVWAAAKAGEVGVVQATAEADPICGACPHLQDTADPVSCRFHASISSRDRKMIAAMGWEENQQVSFADVMDDVHARHRDLMDKVCTGCDWVPICSQQVFTLRDPDFQLESRESGASGPSSESPESPGL